MRFTIRAISFFLALSCFAVLASCGNNGANESETASPFAVESAEPSTESVDHTEEGVRLLYKVSNPAFGSWTVYDYNEHGDIVTEEHSDGQIKYYTYDDSGRLARTDLKNGGGRVLASEKWEYDASGKLFKYTNWAGSLSNTEYVYNEDGRITKAIVEDDDGIREQIYEYFSDGNYSISGKNPNGQEYVVMYNKNGNIISTYNAGTKMSEYTYDTGGKVLRYESYYNSEIFEYTEFRYDEKGVLVEKEVSTEPGRVYYERYEYDDLGEMTRITRITPSGEERIVEEREYTIFSISID